MRIQIQKMIDAVGGLKQFHHQCHLASLALVRSGFLGTEARVARGWHPELNSQHSWVVIGDPYDDDARILDATLWSYTDAKPAIISGTMKTLPHRPHGYGNIWQDGGPPPFPTKPVIRLKGLSTEAHRFLATAAPQGLDQWGWGALAKGPVGGWPAKEIIAKIYQHPKLSSMVPIDIVGMVTDLNPLGLYW